ncbi:hypothetical protein HDU98_005141 [Podochytrium sp. JEL0797]|nr:hypothetical protein HDU98_005141 [Podochytrium sp. JEL0797]
MTAVDVVSDLAAVTSNAAMDSISTLPLVTEAIIQATQWEPTKVKPTKSHKIKNLNVGHWSDLFHFQYSVVPKILVPSLAITAWAAVCCILYQVPAVNILRRWGIPNSTLLVTILGSMMSLLLVFRVNTAYDRFWEGRKLWSNVHSQTRQIARLIWVYCIPTNDDERLRRIGAMNLLIAFSVATKHALRNEPSHRYEDLGPFLQHIRDFAPSKFATKSGMPIPLEITHHLQTYIDKFATIQVPLTNANNALVDCVSSFHRIRTTPIPRAYTIHLKQILMVYLISLPLQLVSSPLGWFTIPVCWIAAFVMMGIDFIAGEIQNPFGYDPNDLPQDEYCTAIRTEILQIMKSHTDTPASHAPWIAPIPLSVDRISIDKLKSRPEVVEAVLREKELEDRAGKKWSVDAVAGVRTVMGKFVTSFKRE